MEFTHRGVQTQPLRSTSHPNPQEVGSNDSSSSSGGSSSKKFNKRDVFGFGKWLRVASVVLLFSITILVISIASLLYYGNGNEAKYVDTSKFQAVDLNVGNASSTDQIYFGHVVKVNDKYLVLQDIYYIVPNQTATPSSSTQSTNNNYTLVKLGCELHAPYDQMVINRDHVVFWENLKASGTVVTKINEYVKQNPNGPNCSAQSSNAAASSSSAAAAAGATTTPTTTTTTTTPTTTTTKKP